MKKTFLVAILLYSVSGFAQSVLYNSSICSVSFPDNDNMKITYCGSGNSETYSFLNVQSLVFKEAPTQPGTSIIMPNQANKVQFTVNANEIIVQSSEAVQALRLFAMSGTVLSQCNSERMNIANLPKGLYILNVQTAKNQTNHKFIKQ